MRRAPRGRVDRNVKKLFDPTLAPVAPPAGAWIETRYMCWAMTGRASSRPPRARG